MILWNFIMILWNLICLLILLSSQFKLHNSLSFSPRYSSAQHMWCFMEEGVLVAKCIVYSLFCGLEAPLIPSIWSVWTSAEWKLPWCFLGPALCLPQCRSCPCTYLLEHFSLETQCLLKRGSCPHVLFPECFVICVVQDAHLSGLLASNLFWWGTFPQVSLGA